jgi:hypothetical protein
VHDFQLINVEDFMGQGEFSPSPYFYQNLGEAEYVVSGLLMLVAPRVDHRRACQVEGRLVEVVVDGS